jgi:chorismate dehydratase
VICAAQNPVCYTFLRKTSTLSKLRISIVQYLNTVPLIYGFTHGSLKGKYELSFTVPSVCAEALRKREADVAIIPAIEYQRIENLVILPNLSIASKQKVRSLLLIAKMPIEEARTIALDSSSRSTQALTKILCARHWKIFAQFVELPPDPQSMLQEADAALLIGDPALRLSLDIEPHATNGAKGEQIVAASVAKVSSAKTLHIYDIVEEWRKFTSLPAVLAIWAAYKDASTPQLAADFQSSLAFGQAHLNEICRDGSNSLGLPAGDLYRYLTENIDFSLDPENLQGLHRFFSEAQSLNLIPQAQAVATTK